jgi:hypothetical protein
MHFETLAKLVQSLGREGAISPRFTVICSGFPIGKSRQFRYRAETSDLPGFPKETVDFTPLILH